MSDLKGQARLLKELPASTREPAAHEKLAVELVSHMPEGAA
jgi:hypothetical protein